MDRLLALNLIHFLDFYFALMLFAGLYRRFGQYRSIAQLVLAGQRWPNLLKLVSEHRAIFMTWSMFVPILLALAILVAQVLASRFIFQRVATDEPLTIARLLEIWPVLFIIGPLGVAMASFDLYTLYLVGQVDRAMLEQYFDQAEYWLRSRTAHVVRVVTFGWINPRRMVAEEVEKALLQVSDMLSFTLWWVIVQMGLRFGFALSLWLTWALTSATE